MMVEMKFVYQ